MVRRFVHTYVHIVHANLSGCMHLNERKMFKTFQIGRAFVQPNETRLAARSLSYCRNEELELININIVQTPQTTTMTISGNDTR